MIQKYTFSGSEEIMFDDEKSVRELVQCAFDRFDYYEPAGMELVTVFQYHHPATNTGWFTTDTARACKDEIVNPNELCFAYSLPGVFYFAEGGWGHHMPELGNHPEIPDPVAISLRFEDFDNTVVINGNYCFHDVLDYLKRTDYIDADCDRITVSPAGTSMCFRLSAEDALLRLKLTAFHAAVSEYTDKLFPRHDYIYRFIYAFEE